VRLIERGGRRATASRVDAELLLQAFLGRAEKQNKKKTRSPLSLALSVAKAEQLQCLPTRLTAGPPTRAAPGQR
jgi:hypothetical protein